MTTLTDRVFFLFILHCAVRRYDGSTQHSILTLCFLLLVSRFLVALDVGERNGTPASAAESASDIYHT